MSEEQRTQKEGLSVSWGRLLYSVSRLHIVVIAALGTLTFGWMMTGRYWWFLSGICALDWFLVNLLNRVVDHKEDQVNSIVATSFASRHQRGIVGGGLLLLVLSFVAQAVLWPWLTPWRLAYHALGLAYNWPLLPGKKRLKQLYFWKNTASALGFLLTLFAYPLSTAFALQQSSLQSHASSMALAPGIGWHTVWVTALFFFLFELSYEVIYDLRDVPGDAQAQIPTYPVVHGPVIAGWIVYGLLALSMLTLALGYLVRVVPWHLFIMIFAPLFQGIYFTRARQRTITAKDCILLTWLGATLLGVYHLWGWLQLPGAESLL